MFPFPHLKHASFQLLLHFGHRFHLFLPIVWCLYSYMSAGWSVKGKNWAEICGFCQNEELYVQGFLSSESL